jgi:hypothetical protein
LRQTFKTTSVLKAVKQVLKRIEIPTFFLREILSEIPFTSPVLPVLSGISHMG